MPSVNRYRSSGFTLMEVMVAVFILSIMAAVAVSGLNAILRAQSQQVKAGQQLEALQLTYGWLAQDLDAFVARSVVSKSGGVLPAMLFNHDPLLSYVGIPGTIFLVLTRGGITDPKNLSSLQRVAYTVHDQQLLRYTWPVLDAAPSTVPQSTVLLRHVASIQTRYLTDQGAYISNWQDYNKETLLPLAVEWQITDTKGQSVTWIFPIIGGGSHETKETEQTTTQ